jgi:hypothetical protein
MEAACLPAYDMEAVFNTCFFDLIASRLAIEVKLFIACAYHYFISIMIYS